MTTIASSLLYGGCSVIEMFIPYQGILHGWNIAGVIYGWIIVTILGALCLSGSRTTSLMTPIDGVLTGIWDGIVVSVFLIPFIIVGGMFAIYRCLRRTVK